MHSAGAEVGQTESEVSSTRMSFEFRAAIAERASISRSSKEDGVLSTWWLPEASEGPQRISDLVAEETKHKTGNPLSSREVDVLRLIASGNSNKRIADQLSIRVATVKSHVTNIFAKLGANDRAHAVAIGLTRGIFEL